MLNKKVRINFALTQEAHSLLQALAEKQGVSMNAMLEILIRSSTTTKKGKSDATKSNRADDSASEHD
jgi:replication initiation and membrane attachment protein DnaB